MHCVFSEPNSSFNNPASDSLLKEGCGEAYKVFQSHDPLHHTCKLKKFLLQVCEILILKHRTVVPPIMLIFATFKKTNFKLDSCDSKESPSISLHSCAIHHHCLSALFVKWSTFTNRKRTIETKWNKRVEDGFNLRHANIKRNQSLNSYQRTSHQHPVPSPQCVYLAIQLVRTILEHQVD